MHGILLQVLKLLPRLFPQPLHIKIYLCQHAQNPDKPPRPLGIRPLQVLVIVLFNGLYPINKLTPIPHQIHQQLPDQAIHPVPRFIVRGAEKLFKISFW